ncbi:hypothetical protein ACFLTB_02140 [Chloroflexota bacterium]
MEEQIRSAYSADTPKIYGAVDPKSRMAEYIATKYGYNSNNDVRSILNETKIGAQRRQTLQKMLNTVFSTH